MAMMFQTLERVMRPDEALRARCACGHEQVWPRAAAWKTFGPGATPYDVRRRLGCKPCKAARRRAGTPTVWIEPHWTPPGR